MMIVRAPRMKASAVAALLFTANPFLAELSIVPYQETLMLASVLFAFAFYFRESVTASAVAIALGCLTAPAVAETAFAVDDRFQGRRPDVHSNREHALFGHSEASRGTD